MYATMDRFSPVVISMPFFVNRAAMGRARFLIYPWFVIFNRAAMGRARFLIYPWFVIFNRAALGRAVLNLPLVYFLTARPWAERGS